MGRVICIFFIAQKKKLCYFIILFVWSKTELLFQDFPKVLAKHRDGIYAGLDSLDPATHSLGYLGIL